MAKKIFPKILTGFLLLMLLIAAFGVKLVDDRYPWLGGYIADQFREKPVKVEGPKHIIFAFLDHFEPHDQKTMDRWMASYPLMADKHKDADGRKPQHTTFWYFDKSDDAEKRSFLRQLGKLAYEGYGEVELHLHHWHDNEESFLGKIKHAIELSHEAGALITAESKPRSAFGFIHGRWSLDNSRGAGDCGVNNEITLLRKLDCYADFTHASWGVMTPRTVNQFYYVTDDPKQPKSYDYGRRMEVGKPGVGDLLLMEGPTVVRFNGLKPVYDNGDVTHIDLPTPERVKKWVDADIHVKGRPEWVFVRVYTHGAAPEDHEAVLGAWRDKLHTYLEENYNDGKKYVLHYVSARETYNIAKAAEDGKSGNPDDYRDYVIPPYVQKYFIADVPFEAISFDKTRAVIRFSGPAGTAVNARLRGKNVQVTGNAVEVQVTPGADETKISFKTAGEGIVGFSFERI